MGWLQKIRAHSVLVRILPFCLFAVLTALQGFTGDQGRFWFYALKTVAGAWLLAVLWKSIPEIEIRFSWEALVAGILVFVLWVGLDPYYPQWSGAGPGWNPHSLFGEQTALAWFFVILRLAGSSLVVPIVEEIFYRSFLYRWLIREDFLSVPLSMLQWKSFLITAVIFGLAHHEWLAGILCAFVYQGLVCLKGRLGDAIVAHGITNLLLGLWVINRDAWNFW